MAAQFENVAFVLEELRFDTPGQQLLDRFLIGYPRDGEFHRPPCKTHLWMPQETFAEEVHRRVADFGLQQEKALEDAIAMADGIVLVPRQTSAGGLLRSIVSSAPPNAAVFVYGAIGDSTEQANTLASHALTRKVPLASGTSTSVTWRLPEIDVPHNAVVSDALIVVQGEFPLAELHAIDGLLPLLARRAGGEHGVRDVQLVEGQQVWKFLAERETARRLLAAALSRSDSPQGLTVRDGRTQNLMAPGLLESMANNPRAWLLEHTDGLHTIIMVLDGVIADFNFALRTKDSNILSAQLYRPPAPQRHEFSRLAEVIENYFRTRQVPWPLNRSVLACDLLARFAQIRNSSTG
jgi:hypothetical protein